VTDVMKEGIIDPLSVKLQAFISATEAATGMMKIDDLQIAESAAREEAANPEAQIAGRTRELIDAERNPPEFDLHGGRLKYTGKDEKKPESVYR